jgi:hypothetical protein
MYHYRIYAVTEDGHVKFMPVTIDCDDDQKAIAHAKAIQNGSTLEVWEGKRRVAVLRNGSQP